MNTKKCIRILFNQQHKLLGTYNHLQNDVENSETILSFHLELGYFLWLQINRTGQNTYDGDVLFLLCVIKLPRTDLQYLVKVYCNYRQEITQEWF